MLQTTLSKNILKVFSSNSIHLVLSLINSILISRFLGVENRGAYVLLSSNILLLTYILGFGHTTTIVFFRAKSKSIGQIMFTTSLIFITTSSSLIILLFYLLFQYTEYEFISAFLPKNIDFILLIAICYLGLTFNLVLGVTSSLFTAQKKFMELNISKIIGQVSLVFSIIILSSFSTNINNNTALALLILIPIVAQLVPFIIRLNFFIPKTIFSFKALKSMILWGGVAYIGGIAQFLSFKLDYWFIEYYLGGSSLGIYSLSSSLAQMLWFIPASIGSVIFPSFINISNLEKRNKTIKIVKLTSVISVFIAIVVYFFSDFTINLVYGQEYRESAKYLKILLIGCVPYAISPIIASYFLSKNLLKYNLAASFFGFLVSLILDIYFIPKYGLTGAAWTTALSYFSTTVFVLFYFFRLERK